MYGLLLLSMYCCMFAIMILVHFIFKNLYFEDEETIFKEIPMSMVNS